MILRRLGDMTIPKRKYARIDTLELKALLGRRVGHHRADKYFDQLRRLFSSKITKSEFDRVCIMVIGRENIPLHNQFIRAILKNACHAKVPPRPQLHPHPRASARMGSLSSVEVSDVRHSSSILTPSGDALSQSPRRVGSFASQDRKFKGRQNALGKSQSLASDEFAFKTQEQQSATELNSLDSRAPVSVEDGEEVKQMNGSPGIQSRSPVTAPLGISMNFGCNRKLAPNVSLCSKYYPETCHSKGDLPDTRSLRSRLEQKLEKEGLSVTVDCVNLLNNALDSYLKRLIESSLDLAGARVGNDQIRLPSRQLINSNGMLPRRYMQTVPRLAEASILDFRLAMELNPQALGPDWPLQLERVSIRASEE
ncbi:hypothetical protein PIB30_061621 [Stylosanthes scabra]|uniref:Transcriptional coactivator Hfi1/Transcriptional adapter 1 n=1 Tax=Stylosanthes scabra TaxID=79078 RepID=A0ABU6ZJM3_9FABA|nr:hypothetical protein [Stylosanthes scabra]